MVVCKANKPRAIVSGDAAAAAATADVPAAADVPAVVTATVLIRSGHFKVVRDMVESALGLVARARA